MVLFVQKKKKKSLRHRISGGVSLTTPICDRVCGGQLLPSRTCPYPKTWNYEYVTLYNKRGYVVMTKVKDVKMGILS